MSDSLKRTWRDLAVIVVAAGVAIAVTRIASPSPPAALTPVPVPAASPAPDSRLEPLEQRVAALELRVAALEQQAPTSPPASAVDGGVLVTALFTELATLRARAEQSRSEFRQRQAKQAVDEADVEIVKLQAAQNRFTPEQTQENVRRRLRPLGLDEAKLEAVLPASAKYLRARIDTLLELLQRVSSGQPVTRAEAEQKLEPLARDFETQLGVLDPLTRKAVVTEVSQMARLPALAFARE